MKIPRPYVKAENRVDKPSGRIALDKVGGTKISTVSLESFEIGWGYETCLFYSNGHSDVVASYDTREDALSSHKQIVERMMKFLHRVEPYPPGPTGGT